MRTVRTINVVPSGLFLKLLTVLFIGLKLTGHIDWSWWWVLAPLWLPFAAFLGLCVIFFGIWVVVMLGALLCAAFNRI